MGQCKALFQTYYCIRDSGHCGNHLTVDNRQFTEQQARYYGMNRPKPSPRPLLERLRKLEPLGSGYHAIACEAADEIERLQRELAAAKQSSSERTD